MNTEIQKSKFSTKQIIPDYLSVDFNTYLNKQIDLLKSMDSFKDYNYEGSNIRLLLEWMSYFASLNTYYLNQIAKNVFDDSAELYHNIHRIAKLKGYNARGYISAWTDLTITIDMYDKNGVMQYDIGDKLYIPEFKILYGTDLENDQVLIPFLTRKSKIIEVTDELFYKEAVQVSTPDFTPGDDYEMLMEPMEEPTYTGSITFDVPIIQGELKELVYTGKDIVDNKLVLPFDEFNHDSNDDNESSSCILKVNRNNMNKSS